MVSIKTYTKKIVSFAGLGMVAFALLFLAGVSTAQAATTVQGDRFDASLSHFIFWYDADNAAATPCNTADGYNGNLIGSTSFTGLDNDKNDNAGWSIVGADYAGNAYLYLCLGSGGGAALLTSTNFAVAASTTYNVDAGWANEGGGVSNDLDTKNVVICDELDGTKLSTQAKAVSGTTFNQYYFKREGGISNITNNDVYILITDSDACTFDNGVLAATQMVTNGGTYGVQMSFAADLKIAGDAHSTLTSNNLLTFTDSGNVVGLAETIAAPDGLDNCTYATGANCDYLTYIDSAAAGATYNIALSKTGVTTQTVATIPIATTSIDFVVHVAGTVPADVDYIAYDDAVGATTYTQSTVPVAQAYDLYVADDGTGVNESITMKDGGAAGTTVIVFNNAAPRITEDVTCTAGNFFQIGNVAAAGDNDWDGDDECTTVDVAKVYGTLDDTFATAGANERIRVTDDYTLMTAFGGGDTNIFYDTTDLGVTPLAGGEEYKVYFGIHYADDAGVTTGTADTTYDMHLTSSAAGEDYISILNDWTTTIAAGNSVAKNLEYKLSGDTPDGAGEVVYLTDGAGGTVEAGAVTAASGLYEIYMYSVTGGANEYFDYESPQGSNVLRIDSGGTDFSADYQFDVAKITGDDADIHADLLNGGGGATNDEVRVTDAAADNSGANLYSTAGVIDSTDDAGVTNDTYSVYFQVPADGLVNFVVHDGDGDAGADFFIYNIVSVAGASYVFEPNAKLTATVTAVGDNVEVVSDAVTDLYLVYRNNGDDATKYIYIDTNAQDPDGAASVATLPTSDTTGTYNLYTDDTFATLVLTRGTKDLTAAAQTWDVAKATGALHANLQTDDDYVRVCTTTACTTLLSSADPTMTGGTYTIYYEISGVGTDILHIFDEDGDPDYNSYIDIKYWNNPMAGTDVAAGDTDTIALTTLNDGTVHADILWVWVDSDGVEDALWILAGQVASDGIYRVYSNYAAQSYYKKFDDDAAENTGTPNVNLEIQELMSVQTLDVGQVAGDLPADFNGDGVELETTGLGHACGASINDYGRSGGIDTVAADVTLQTPDYKLYYEADTTTYDVLFCDGVTLELVRPVTSVTGGEAQTMDVAKVSGASHADFNDDLAQVLADDMAVYSNATCTTKISSQDEQPAAAAYAQFYETGAAGSYYLGAKVVIDSGGGGDLIHTSCVTFAGSGPGAADTLNVIRKLSGTVHADVLSIAVDIDGDAVMDSYTNDTVSAVDNAYRMYSTNGDGTDNARFYPAVNKGGTLLLSRDAVLNADETMDVNRMTGNIHDDFDDTGNDNVAVYDADACTTLLSSEDFVFVEAGTDTYTQYYERTGSNFTLQITRTSGGNDFVTCFATEVAQPAAGGSTAQNLLVKVDGTVPDDIDDVQIDPDEDTVFEVTQNIVETDPDTYKIYFGGDATSDIQWRDGATVELLNLGAADANVDLSGSTTINLASVTGNAHADLGIADAVAVCKAFPAAGSCQGSADEMSSAAETPGATYEQHFYIDPAATYFVVETTTVTPSYSYARIDGVAAGATITVDLDAKLSGDTALVPTAIDFVWLDTATANTPAAVAEYAAAAIGAGDYALYYDSAVTAGDLKADTGRDVSVAEANGVNVVLSITKAVLPAAWYVGSAYGLTHANLQGGADTVEVCNVDDDYSTPTVDGIDCSTPVSSATVNPGAGTYPAVNDYAIYYEMANAGGNYWLKVTDAATNYITYAISVSAAGDRDINTELDGILSGTVREAYDNTTPIENVFIGIYAVGWDAATVPDNANIQALGYSEADGTYIVYTDAGVNYDFEYKKDSYITQSAATNNDASNTLPSDMDNVPLAVGVTVDLVAGIKVTVLDGGAHPITDATVAIYTCTAGGDGSNPSACTTWTLNATCTNPAGNCTRNGNSTAGNGLAGEYYFTGIAFGTYLQIRVSDPTAPPVFETIFSPDSSETTNSFVTSATTVVTATVVPYNPAPECNLRVEGGAGTYTAAGVLYARATQTVNVFMDCGETGLDSVILNGANIDSGEGAAAMVDDGTGIDAAAGDGTYSYQLTVDQAGTGSYSITATADDGVNTDSKTLWVTIDNTVPNNATNLIVQGGTDDNTSEVDLDGNVSWNWTAGTDADSGLKNYEIVLQSDTACNLFAGAETTVWTKYTTDVSYNVSNLTDGLCYRMRVKAADNVGNIAAAYLDDNDARVLIDITAPAELSLVIENGADYTNDKDALTLAYAGQDVTTFALSCDGTTWVNLGASPQDIDLDVFGGGCTIANGNKVFYLRATDANGNTEETSDEIVLDDVAPTIGVLTAANVAGQSLVTLTWTAAADATSGVSYYDVYRDPATGVNKTDTIVASGLTTLGFLDYSEDGTWYYTVYATDNAGNESLLFVEKTVTVDTTAPVEQSIVINSNALYANSVALTLKIYSEGADGYSLSCEPDQGWSANTAYTAGTYTDVAFNLTTVNGTLGCTNADGFKTVYVRFKDAYNNYSTLSDTITLDVTAPTIGVLTAANVAGQRTVTLTWTAATDATSGVSYYDVYRDPLTGVNKTDTLVASGLTTLGFLDYPEDGTWYYTVYATDKANNESVLFVEKTVTVDTTPVGIVSTPVFGTYNAATLVAAGGVTITPDAAGTCKWDTMDATYAVMDGAGVDGEFAVLAATAYDLTVLADADDYTLLQGLNEVYVRCKDASNNENLNSTHISFHYDITAPTYQLASVISDGNGQTVGGALYANQGDTVTVKFQASEALAGNPNVTIGGQVMAFVSNLGGLYTYNRVLTNAETTTAIVTISGTTDVAGNDDTDYTDGGANFEFDFTAPAITVTEPGNQNSRSFQATVTAAGAEAGLTCKMSTNNVGYDAMEEYLADVGAGTYQGMLVVPADGNYNIYAVCRDSAGNEGADNTNAAFAVQSVAPVVANSAPVNGTYNAGTLPAITITTDVNANCAWDTNDASYANMPGANQFATVGGVATALAGAAAAEGLNAFYIRCQTTVTAVEMSSSAMIIFTYDSVAPNTPVIFLPTTGTAYQTGSILAWSAPTDATSGVASYDLQIDDTAGCGSPEVNLPALTTTAYELTVGNKAALNAGVNYWRVMATDNAGNAGAWTACNSTFTLDKTAPTVEEMSPADDAIGVSVNVAPMLIFDERVEPSTLIAANIQLRKYADDSVVALDVTGGIISENYIGEDGVLKTYVIIAPAAALDYGIKYYVTISAAVVDLSGNPFVAWTVGTKADHEFTIAALVTGNLGVMGITQTKSWGTADNTYGNGWEWVIRATIPTDELGVALKFNNWTGTGAATIAAANNIRYYCPQSLANGVGNPVTIAAANTYPADMTIVAANDLDANTDGVQVDITVQAKIPLGSTAGAYSTSYGIRSQ